MLSQKENTKDRTYTQIKLQTCLKLHEYHLILYTYILQNQMAKNKLSEYMVQAHQNHCVL